MFDKVTVIVSVGPTSEVKTSSLEYLPFSIVLSFNNSNSQSSLLEPIVK